MNLSRQEFLQLLDVAAAPGMPMAANCAYTAAQAGSLYDLGKARAGTEPPEVDRNRRQPRYCQVTRHPAYGERRRFRESGRMNIIKNQPIMIAKQ
ncbi:MAG: hypothetical protein ACO273_12065 [Burkholderiales bacterium]